MKELLNKEFVFRLKLLDNLSRERLNGTSALSVSDYASKLSKDRRTILKNIEALKIDIKRLGCEKYITISLSDESTIFTEITPDFDTNYFFLYYLEHSILFNLCLEIFNETFVDLQSFATKRFYSYSTVYRKMTDLKKIVAQYDLTLDLNTSTLIQGKEQNIRFFFFSLFWESYKVLEWPFPSIDFDKLKKTLESSSPEVQPFLEKPNMVFIWFAMTIFRITNDHIIDEEFDYNESTFPMLAKEKFIFFSQPLLKAILN